MKGSDTGGLIERLWVPTGMICSIFLESSWLNVELQWFKCLYITQFFTVEGNLEASITVTFGED